MKFKKYKDGSDKIEADLKEQHVIKLEEAKARLEAQQQKLPPKFSVEYLNLQRILKTVVKNKDYKEAHAIQSRLNALAEVEKEHWTQQQQAKLAHHLGQVKKAQQKELNSLQKRADNGLNELKKAQSEEYETLIKKYQNREKITTTQQNKERTALLKLNVPGIASALLNLRPSSARVTKSGISLSPTKSLSKEP